MNDAQLGGAVRLLRHRHGWRQEDLAARANSSSSVISRLESGRVTALNVGALRRIADALGMPLSWDIGPRRAEVEQLRDAGHAALANAFHQLLDLNGWQVRAEVSFDHFGDRGRVDLLAHHPVARIALAVEIKTMLVDAQEVLGALDVKRRLGLGIARDLGWQADVVVPAIVFAETSSVRRRVAAHDRLFARYGLRGQHALAWLRRPEGRPDGILLFTRLSDSRRRGANRSPRRRVRLRTASPSVTRAPRTASNGSEHG